MELQVNSVNIYYNVEIRAKHFKTFLVILIRRARRFMHSYHQKSSSVTQASKQQSIQSKGDLTQSQVGLPKRKASLKERFPLWKLSLNVSTFAFFNMFYVSFLNWDRI